MQLSVRVERLLLLFPLACAVVAAFGESLPLALKPASSSVPHAHSAASATAEADGLQARAAVQPGTATLAQPCHSDCAHLNP